MRGPMRIHNRRLRGDPFNGVGRFSDASGTSDVKTRLGFLPDPASQLGAFETPTLRNVALTAPYMHDGRFTTLEQALDFYGQGKLATTRQSRTVVMHAAPC
jgi:cytochrome c peroxidase